VEIRRVSLGAANNAVCFVSLFAFFAFVVDAIVHFVFAALVVDACGRRGGRRKGRVEVATSCSFALPDVRVPKVLHWRHAAHRRVHETLGSIQRCERNLEAS